MTRREDSVVSQQDTLELPVVLEGPPGIKGLVLHSATISEALGRPFQIELEVSASQGRPKPGDVLGQAMTVKLALGTGVRPFHGLVSDLSFTGMHNSMAQYSLTLRPWIWFLGRASNCRIFQNKSVPDILVEVFAEHELEASKAFEQRPLSVPHLPREFVVQYRESDLDFVTRLMEEEGLYYYFEHHSDKHVLVLCDDASHHREADDCKRLTYFAEDQQRHAHLEYIHRWVSQSRVRPETYSVKAFDFEKPRVALKGSAQAPGGHPLGGFEIYDYPAPFTSPEQGNALSSVRLQELQARAEHAEAGSNARGIRCGSVLQVDHPADEHAGPYLVSSTVIHIEAQASTSRPADPSRLIQCDFTAHRAELPYRLPRATAKPIIHGAQTGVVSGPPQEQIETDKYGRVRVKFHWDRSDAINEHASCWVRVSEQWAGAGFGSLHLPRIGQEVIVQFLDGDPDRPIVIGRVYNGAHEPPFLLPKHKTQSGIRTSTVKGEPQQYNEIRFEDAAGVEELAIRAQRNLTAQVNNNQTVRVHGDDALSVGGNQTIRIQGDASLHVGETGGMYVVSATKSISLQAPESIELHCGKSCLRLTPDSIVLIAGTGAQLALTNMVLASSKAGSEIMLSEGVTCCSSRDEARLELFGSARLCVQGKAELFLGSDALLRGEVISLEAGSRVGATGKRLDLTATDTVCVQGKTVELSAEGGADLKGMPINLN